MSNSYMKGLHTYDDGYELYTLYVKCERGSVEDLNAYGKPANTEDELEKFIKECCKQGLYADDIRDCILEASYNRWV